MSNKNNNQINVPEAREAMDKFKMQTASEVGVNLTNGYNGHLTSREAGSIGDYIVFHRNYSVISFNIATEQQIIYSSEQTKTE